MRQLLDEFDRVRKPPFGDLAREELENFGLIDLTIVIPNDEQKRPLIPLWMRNADRGCFEDARAADCSILELDRADPFAAGLDHILGAVRDPDRAVGVYGCHVPSVEPLAFFAGVFLLLEIAADDGRPSGLEPSRADAVAGLRFSVGVHGT